MLRRVGVMTGGGDCPGLNAVIRAVVEVLVAEGVEVLGIEDAFHGLVDPTRHAPHGNLVLTPTQTRPLVARGGTILGTSNRGDPFHFVIEEGGVEREIDISERVIENAAILGLDGVITIGGDGSMRIAQRFLEKGLRVIGVPKTIDNDLAATDQTFGFDTAVGIAVEAIDRLHDTAESHDRVMLVEVMGRDAGFIALHAGLAGGADVILVPEIPYELAPVARQIRHRRADGQAFAIVVVAEGAKPAGGTASVLEHKAGAMPRLMGAGLRVEQGLSELVTAEIRTTVLGHVQRGGRPSAFDRVLATRYGVAAAELALEGAWGKMVALRGRDIVSVPIAEAAGATRRVEIDGPIVRTARRLGIVLGDEPG